jgi:hypothetical protein
MPVDTASTEKRCPMCGAALSGDAEFCAECGERVGERTLRDFERVPSFPEQRYERNLHVLEWLLIIFGHLTFVVSIIVVFLIAPFTPEKYTGPMFDVGLIAFFAGSAWIVAGYACACKKRWGLLTAVIVSYLMLGGCLLYWNLTGIAVSLILSIQSHRVLRFSHQVLAAKLESEKDLSR